MAEDKGVFDVKLIDYLPPVTAQISDFEELCATEQTMFDACVSSCDKVRNEYSLYYSEGYALSVYENMLSLSAKGNLETRRYRVLDWLNGMREKVISYVSDLCDDAVQAYSFSSDDFVLRVKVKKSKAEYLQKINSLLEEFLPCNVVIKTELAYSTHKQLKQYTHKELSQFTNLDLKGYEDED